MSTPPDDKPIYRLLTGKDDRAFCDRVSEALAQGWRLYGSPTIADADRIFVLNEGKLAESGSHNELLRAEGLYAEMWNRQASEIEEVSEAAE